ncbi:MAG: diguanylate cyclase [Lachnospiraceae bacterium]|nr:diguanylate cyclase [Lachnospiraceae bacterium]
MKKKQSVRPQTIVIFLVMTVVILILLHQAFSRVRDLYNNQLYANSLELRKHFLENTVNNLVEDIVTERAVRTKEYEDQVESCRDYVHLIAEESKDDPAGAVKEYFDGRPDSLNWTCMAYDVNTNDVIYDTAGLLGDAWDGNEDEFKNSFISSDSFRVGDTAIIYGITRQTMDDIVKKSISQKVSYNKFEGNTWLWINELRNYNGGKNYAARLVNPEEKNTEGRLLSTSEKDAEGKEYLQEELDKINDLGNAQYSYSIKNKDGSRSSRIVYSKLFKDYNWIVGMGSNMDDIDLYVKNTRAPVEKYMIRFELVVAVIFILLLAFMVVMTLRSDREFTAKITNRLRHLVERDALTKATSRQYGEEKLKEFFEAFKKGKPSPAIMLLDVDHFKEINDTYGHDVGDVVLKRVVTSLYHTFRKSDYLIRWGGDEFVGVYLGLDEDAVRMIAVKVMEAVHMVKVTTEDGTELSMTASIGIAGFASTDTEYMDGIKRADNMLYESKAGGRDQFHIAEKDQAIDESKQSDKLARGKSPD